MLRTEKGREIQWPGARGPGPCMPRTPSDQTPCSWSFCSAASWRAWSSAYLQSWHRGRQLARRRSQTRTLKCVAIRTASKSHRRPVPVQNCPATLLYALLIACSQLFEDGMPLPLWLKDRKHLNPLLAAYDEKIAALETDASTRGSMLAKLEQQVCNKALHQGSKTATDKSSCVCSVRRHRRLSTLVSSARLYCAQVEGVITENDQLRSQLTRTLESQAVTAAVAENAAGLGADSSLALLREEADLLRQVRLHSHPLSHTHTHTCRYL